MSIGVVIVTYNRLNELKKTLKCYEEQTQKPKYIIVVNNNSSDGTTEFLREWKLDHSNTDKYLIELNKNIGGSGGFHEGLKLSLKLEAEWVWVADDDAYPHENAIEVANSFLKKMSYNEKDVSAICGMVINNGNIDFQHRRRVKHNIFTIDQIPCNLKDYDKEYFELDLFSYVGSIINVDIMSKVGLTEKDYFIYYDDTEHSYRLSQNGKIFCVPGIKINHDIQESQINILNWKVYYSIRNKLDFYRKNFPKRYYYFLKWKYLIKANLKFILKSDCIYKEIVYTAMKDEKSGKFGLHEKYRPGWNPNN